MIDGRFAPPELAGAGTELRLTHRALRGKTVMMSWFGIVAARELNGTFAVPMKTVGLGSSVTSGAVFSIIAMVVIPWISVLLAVPGWKSYSPDHPDGLEGLIALGLLWGVASLLYGLAIDILGIALGFSIQLGLSIVIGALIPFVSLRGFAVADISRRRIFRGINHDGGRRDPVRARRTTH